MQIIYVVFLLKELTPILAMRKQFGQLELFGSNHYTFGQNIKHFFRTWE